MNPIEGLYDDEDTKLRRSVEKSLGNHRYGIPGGQLLFTRQEVAAVLRTKPETIDKMVAKGRIAAILLDEDEPPLFRAESILDFLDSALPDSPKRRRRREGRGDDYDDEDEEG